MEVTDVSSCNRTMPECLPKDLKVPRVNALTVHWYVIIIFLHTYHTYVVCLPHEKKVIGACENSAGPDQYAHLHSVFRTFTLLY